LATALETPQRRFVQVTRIPPGAAAQGPDAEPRRHPGQEHAAAEARDVAALRREMEQRALPPGPPPTFKLNLLDIDGDLRQAIARNEAHRARFVSAEALRPNPPEPRNPSGASNPPEPAQLTAAANASPKAPSIPD
jgi:hypothetical protein